MGSQWDFEGEPRYGSQVSAEEGWNEYRWRWDSICSAYDIKVNEHAAAGEGLVYGVKCNNDIGNSVIVKVAKRDHAFSRC